MAKKLTFNEQWELDHPLVDCDRECGALNDPKTTEELKAALEHAKYHGFLSGCSHGC